ncbi:MAG: hypothetical protein AB7U85_04370 [Alphaproteobacteria bacterium]
MIVSEKRNKAVLVYLSNQEKLELVRLSKAYGLRQSEFLRKTALKTPLPNIEKQEKIKLLLKVNADLARLGNLLKINIDRLSQNLADEVAITLRVLRDVLKEFK